MSREQVKGAPNIAVEGEKLSQVNQATLGHHYQFTTRRRARRVGSGSPAA